MTATIHEVLTLEEAADYLRLPVETIEREAARGRIPGRRVEETWRFLKTAIDEWLGDWEGRETLLQQAGTLAEDETLAELRASVYAKRGRPEADSEKVCN